MACEQNVKKLPRGTLMARRYASGIMNPESLTETPFWHKAGY